MVEVRNFLQGNGNISTIAQLGSMRVIQHDRDMSVGFGEAVNEFYAAKMDLRKRQLVCEMCGKDIILEAGAMQWIAGNIAAKTDVKGVGDLVSKVFKAKVTNETAIKPRYTGTGWLVCEPTYKHLLLVNPADWSGGMVLSDGMFLACEATIEQSIVRRENVSSTVAGGEGFFNLVLTGSGAACLKCRYPKAELVELVLDNDVVRIDGSYAVAWSKSLTFTVEKVTKSLVGSAASGEGLVNVYRGTGRVWMMPV